MHKGDIESEHINRKLQKQSELELNSSILSSNAHFRCTLPPDETVDSRGEPFVQVFLALFSSF